MGGAQERRGRLAIRGSGRRWARAAGRVRSRRRASALAVPGLAACVVAAALSGCSAPAGSPRSRGGGVVHRLSAGVAPARRADSPAAASARPHRPGTGYRVIVLGDSTAAATGLPALPHPSLADRACGRGAGSYARDLAAANGWRVSNLACDGATIPRGLLGPQFQRGVWLPAQMDRAARDGRVNAVVVSVGADDVGWAGQVVSCALDRGCGGAAAAAAFRTRLAAFSIQYQALLERLAQLPGHPRVLVNEYYDPFGSAPDCLAVVGIGPGSVRVLRQRLADLNAVLANGARRAGFDAVRTSIAGHEMCDSQPWVQGLLSPAPFHPTGAGEQAIARADTAALRQPL